MKSTVLSKNCYDLLKRIPKAKVTTYKELAIALNTNAYRAIGQILKKNLNPNSAPCYKVVKSNGEIGGYCGSGIENISKKITLLKKDSIKIKNNKIDLSKYLHKFEKTIYDEFDSPRNTKEF